jgi:lipopolysaccharide export system permease protein
MQAVNYFDFVTQDGHGLKTYFSYILLNFPKILHRITPFIFFISLFFIINDYEAKNELLIFWTNGISKISFTNKVIILSFFLMVFQILMGSFVSPFSQLKARDFLKKSNVDFFTSLIKEGKFINVVDGLTIFINQKNKGNNFSEIYLDDSSRSNKRVIYAKNGTVMDDGNKKVFKLFEGKIINIDKNKLNTFEFDQIDFNLADYSTTSILHPKIQEMPSKSLIECSYKIFKNKKIDNSNKFKCTKSSHNEINQELFKRFYKPLYIPIIALLTCFLIVFPKNSSSYKKNRRIIFLITFFILILSEASLRYATSSYLASTIYMMVPWIIFLSIYLFFFNRIKNV